MESPVTMSPDTRRQRGHHREAAGHLAQVDEGHGVHAIEVVADPAPVAQGDAGAAGLELTDVGADGSV